MNPPAAQKNNNVQRQRYSFLLATRQAEITHQEMIEQALAKKLAAEALIQKRKVQNAKHAAAQKLKKQSGDTCNTLLNNNIHTKRLETKADTPRNSATGAALPRRGSSRSSAILSFQSRRSKSSDGNSDNGNDEDEENCVEVSRASACDSRNSGANNSDCFMSTEEVATLVKNVYGTSSGSVDDVVALVDAFFELMEAVQPSNATSVTSSNSRTHSKKLAQSGAKLISAITQVMPQSATNKSIAIPTSSTQTRAQKPTTAATLSKKRKVDKETLDETQQIPPAKAVKMDHVFADQEGSQTSTLDALVANESRTQRQSTDGYAAEAVMMVTTATPPVPQRGPPPSEPTIVGTDNAAPATTAVDIKPKKNTTEMMMEARVVWLRRQKEKEERLALLEKSEHSAPTALQQTTSSVVATDESVTSANESAAAPAASISTAVVLAAAAAPAALALSIDTGGESASSSTPVAVKPLAFTPKASKPSASAASLPPAAPIRSATPTHIAAAVAAPLQLVPALISRHPNTTNSGGGKAVPPPPVAASRQYSGTNSYLEEESDDQGVSHSKVAKTTKVTKPSSSVVDSEAAERLREKKRRELERARELADPRYLEKKKASKLTESLLRKGKALMANTAGAARTGGSTVAPVVQAVRTPGSVATTSSSNSQLHQRAINGPPLSLGARRLSDETSSQTSSATLHRSALMNAANGGAPAGGTASGSLRK